MDETAYHRKRVLDFWGKHGLDATLDAFKVSRRTLYAWRRAFLSSGSLWLIFVPGVVRPGRNVSRNGISV
ncbi:MAG: hypothetical protein KGI54_12685 [Pseudomonadota bacterium]|nr:hypothetical protein [Pseudomonadota bacterium]